MGHGQAMGRPCMDGDPPTVLLHLPITLSVTFISCRRSLGRSLLIPLRVPFFLTLFSLRPYDRQIRRPGRVALFLFLHLHIGSLLFGDSSFSETTIPCPSFFRYLYINPPGRTSRSFSLLALSSFCSYAEIIRQHPQTSSCTTVPPLRVSPTIQSLITNRSKLPSIPSWRPNHNHL